MFRLFNRLIVSIIYISFISVIAIHIVDPLHSGVYSKTIYPVLSLGLVAFIIYHVRSRGLRKELVNYFRNILAGKYDIGLKTSASPDDEIAEVAKLANKSAQVLNTYDKLRADKTSLSYRIMDTIYQQSRDPLALYDPEKEQLKFNLMAQDLLDISKESFPKESLANIDENIDFLDLLEKSVLIERIEKNGVVKIKLPVNETPTHVYLTIKPFKNMKEVVKTALIYLEKAERN